MLQRLHIGRSASGIASPNPQRAEPAVPNLRVPSAALRAARAWGTPSAWHCRLRDPAPPLPAPALQAARAGRSAGQTGGR